jgi:hypothetical protein
MDCARHDAAPAVKRHARPFLPLRSSGVSSFVAALSERAQASA